MNYIFLNLLMEENFEDKTIFCVFKNIWNVQVKVITFDQQPENMP